MKDLTPIFSAVISFAVTALLGFVVIPFLHKLKFGQTIREIGPSWHKNKQGTPTMGGVMIMAGVLVSLLFAFAIAFLIKGDFYSDITNPKRFAMMISGVVMAYAMGLIGFADDFIKVVKKRNLGLTVLQKTIMQSFVCAAYLVALAFAGMDQTWLPFVGFVDITSGAGLLAWPIMFFFIYGFTNAVNLTDGIDGLASTVTLVVCCTFMLISGFTSLIAIDTFAAVAAGACAGFLVWNFHPAKVFMGDTGSMFLGGVVVALAFGTQRPVLLLAAGIVYLCEALSVVLQVASFKLTGKRIFKMSPIHHHFEMSGWNEEKIDFVFGFVTLLGGIVAVLPVLLNK